SDRITVLRRGRVSGALTRDELAELDDGDATDRIVSLMFGGNLPEYVQIGRSRPGDLRLRIDRISARDDRGALALRECSIGLKAGEIIGLAGVDGNGQRELVEAIAGLRPITTGVISIEGGDIAHLGV